MSPHANSKMNRQEVTEKLNEVFADVFDDDSITVNDETTANDIEDWDSLTHISLLGAVEDEFGIRFNMKAVQELKNVGDMIDMIMELM